MSAVAPSVSEAVNMTKVEEILEEASILSGQEVYQDICICTCKSANTNPAPSQHDVFFEIITLAGIHVNASSDCIREAKESFMRSDGAW